MPTAARKRTTGKRVDLRGCLEEACRKRRDGVFGVVSVDDVDAMPRIRIPVYNKNSIKIRSKMADAKSVVLYGILSTDDVDELSVRRGKDLWAYPGYEYLYRIQGDVIRILRDEGFKAERVPYLVPLKRLAVLAGIGAYAKNSMILSREYGLWLRLDAVMTDASLPIDEPFEGDICGDCDRCMRVCPTKAIRPYVVDGSKCLVHLMEQDDPGELYRKYQKRFVPRLTPNTSRMCTACQIVCPFTSDERREKVIEC